MKMQFPKSVRYKWETHPPFTTFEVDDKDVESMKKMGGFPVTPKVVDKPVAPKEEKKEDLKEEAKEEEPKEEKRPLDILREKADELGIEYPIQWGVNKLKEEINKAEKGE